MSKINVNNSIELIRKKWVTPEMKTLVDKFELIDASFKIDVVDAYFYDTNIEISDNSEDEHVSEVMGMYGCTENEPIRTKDEINKIIEAKSKFEKKMMILNISITDHIDKSKYDDIRKILDTLIITKSVNNSNCFALKVKSKLKNIINTKTNTAKYGIYKRDNFDSILDLIPSLDNNAMKLIGYRSSHYPHDDTTVYCDRNIINYSINDDFVYTKKHNTDTDCLVVYYKDKIIKTNTDKYKLKISLINTDILPNMDKLTELIEILK